MANEFIWYTHSLGEKPKKLKIGEDNGTFREIETNKIFQYRGITAFDTFHNYLDGWNVDPFLRYSIASGANVLRVFGMWKITEFDVKNYPNYWDKTDKFLDYCASYGLYVAFVIFTSTQDLMPERREQSAWYENALQRLKKHDNVLAVLGNQPYQDGPILDICHKEPGILQASGDFDDNDYLLDYGTFQSDRGINWPKGLKGIIEYRNAWHIPVVADEPDRLEFKNVVDSQDAGGVAGLFGGATAHSITLQRFRQWGLPVGNENVCIKAFLKGMKNVPLDAPLGRYTASHLSEFPMAGEGDTDALREYGMILGNKAYVQLVRPYEWNPRAAQNGWHIVENKDNFYILEK